MSNKLITFTGDVPVSYDHPRPERLVSGNPLRSTREHYDHAGVSSGIWSCEMGAWRIAFDPAKDEFFHVISGRIRITNDDGEIQEFGPGDACIIPGGFRGIFEVIEPVTKHYVFIDRNASQG